VNFSNLLGFVPKAGHRVDIPTCDVCGRLVDGFHQWEDRARGEWHLIAVCHGEVEEVILSYSFLDAHPQLVTGRAFVGPKRLGGG
jgi:hypothetical protein